MRMKRYRISKNCRIQLEKQSDVRFIIEISFGRICVGFIYQSILDWRHVKGKKVRGKKWF